MDVFLAIFAIAVTILVGVMLVKHIKPAIILMLAGFLLFLVSLICNPDLTLLEESKSSGSRWLDIIQMFETVAGGQLTGVGLIIMSAGGFSAYMNKIGATRALVRVLAKPISRIKHKYLVLVFAYIIGAFLFMFIPSAAGLATLLIVLLLPVLIEAGLSAAAGAAVIVTATGLPMGPAAGTSVLAARTAGLSPVVYFVQYQLPIAVPAIIAVAITHYFVQRHYDKLNREKYAETTFTSDDETIEAPSWYAIFLVLPIVFLIIMSPLVNSPVTMSTITAFVSVWLIAMFVEMFRKRSIKASLDDASSMFSGMGKMFTSVVALIIGAQIFANGLNASGLIDMIINGAKGLGWGIIPMMIIFTLIVGLVTFLTGSGVAAFSSFAGLAPDIAEGVGGSTAALVTPMQFASSLFRAVSPIAGVVIVTAGAVGLQPVDVIKRTAIPMAVGFIVVMVLSCLFA